MAQKGKTKSGEKTVIKGTCLSSFGDNSNVTCVDVKDDKIVPIPRRCTMIGSINRRNLIRRDTRRAVRLLRHPLKRRYPPHGIAYKKRIYSPNRILYPLKRVDWDPKGERNPQNRGKSKYVRISWDEA